MRKQTFTQDVVDYIKLRKEQARNEGKTELVLTSREIHEAMDYSKRYPIVCSAMKKCMLDQDIYLNTTDSGKSTTISIKYFI